MMHVLWKQPSLEVRQMLFASHVDKCEVARVGTFLKLWCDLRGARLRCIEAQQKPGILHERTIGAVPLDQIPKQLHVADGQFCNRWC